MSLLRSFSKCYLFNAYTKFRIWGNVQVLMNINERSFFRHTSTSVPQSQNEEIKSETPPETESNLIARIVDADQSLEDKLGIISLEVYTLRLMEQRVPSYLVLNEWLELTRLETKRARRKYLEFCWKKRMRKANLERKRKKKLLSDEKLSLLEDHILYDRVYNTLSLPISNNIMDQFFNAKLIQAMQFNQEIVIDCFYENVMTRREIVNCGKQLKEVFASNRACPQPFNLYFCNAPKTNTIIQEFVRIVKTAHEPYFPINIQDECYLDLFPKKKLVYLTPDSSDVLENYDHDAVYIIGAIVDRYFHHPWSFERASEQGIKTFKLPLDKYISWSPGSGKCLTLDQMIKIMLDLKQTGDWTIALKHIPKRKVLKMK